MQQAPEIPSNLASVVEAILFAAERPLSAVEIADIISRADETLLEQACVERALEALRARLQDAASGFELVEVGIGWEFRTRAELAGYIHVMYRRRPVRLSRAALEVLAIVAYRQPCTRADIDDVRGVDSSGTLRPLLDRGLVRILGKADDVGRPLIYGTGPKFLEFFGLRSLSDLPTLREFTELTEEHLVRLQALDETLQANRDGEPSEEQQEIPDA